MTLSNASVIPGLHANIFIVLCAQQKGFQVMSEVQALIMTKHSTRIHFDREMANKSSEGFLITTKFYKGANDNNIFSPRSRSQKVRHMCIQKEQPSINKII